MELKSETGLEFLLRMRSEEKFTINGFDSLTTSDFVLLSTPCSYTKSALVTRIVAQSILPKAYGGLERRVLLMDLVICHSLKLILLNNNILDKYSPPIIYEIRKKSYRRPLKLTAIYLA